MQKAANYVINMFTSDDRYMWDKWKTRHWLFSSKTLASI